MHAGSFHYSRRSQWARESHTQNAGFGRERGVLPEPPSWCRHQAVLGAFRPPSSQITMLAHRAAPPEWIATREKKFPSIPAVQCELRQWECRAFLCPLA
jgi:hypothetical protein